MDYNSCSSDCVFPSRRDSGLSHKEAANVAQTEEGKGFEKPGRGLKTRERRRLKGGEKKHWAYVLYEAFFNCSLFDFHQFACSNTSLFLVIFSHYYFFYK